MKMSVNCATKNDCPSVSSRQKVGLIGSGNWGSVIANIIGRNVINLPNFDPEIRMWVYEEMVGDRKLTEIINTDHENIRYMPGLKLPENVVACSDVCHAAADATILIFVLPQQFIKSVCATLRPIIRQDSFVISLIKGLFFENSSLQLISEVILRELGIAKNSLAPPPATLMGANVASEIAGGNYSEATLACSSFPHARLAASLFNCPKFRVNPVTDLFATEMCGALKNIVALGAGMIDGLNWGSNAKAAVMRVGFREMVLLIELLRSIRNNGDKAVAKKSIEDVLHSSATKNLLTYFESCGIGDVITTCFAGRHRLVAEQVVRTGRPLEEVERETLKGQKLQGTVCSIEVHKMIKHNNWGANFPLMETVYEILFEGHEPDKIVSKL